MVTHLQPDMLQCEVKWALGIITTKLVEEISPELFKILNDAAVKVLHPICQQIWKTQQGPHD